MSDDDLTPEEQAAAEAERMRTSARGAASDLARMGIDPSILGIETDRRTQPARAPESPRAPGTNAPESRSQPRPPGPHDPGNVVPLRGGEPSPRLPRSGTSPAWAPGPPGVEQSGPAYGAETPLDRVLGDTPGGGGSSVDPGRLAKAVTFGLLTPDAAEVAKREQEIVGRVRTRQTEKRVVAFVSGKGGVGTTTVATGVGCVFAALREDTSALVSVRSGEASLGRALAGQPAPSARELVRSTQDVEPLRLSNGLLLVDGPRWGTPLQRPDIPTVTDKVAESAAFVLFDVGNDSSDAAHAAVGQADQVVIVSGTGPQGVDSARVAAERVADLDPLLLDTAVYVIVCQRDEAMRTVVRRMRSELPEGGRIVALPPEDFLAAGAAFDPGRVSAGTRLGLIDVAGLVALRRVAQYQGR